MAVKNSVLNATHDPSRRSWVSSANLRDSPFPIQNLPLGVFVRASNLPSSSMQPAIGVAIGDRILDLRACQSDGIFASLPLELAQACAATTLNPLMTLGSGAASALRALLSDLLWQDHALAANHQRQLSPHLMPAAEATLLKPVLVGGYTDFYASIFHATNVGRLFRPDNPLLPNYKHVPIGYHGRASSLVVSGAAIRRPYGQVLPSGATSPEFVPSRSLDYELEVGFFAGKGNALGEAIPIEQAPSHIFGFCLVNDWSARDIQAWEYQPLGPFLSKNFATSISPWVVTSEALAPFRTNAFARSANDPRPLPYLQSDDDQRNGALDLKLEVHLRSARMREAGDAPVLLSRTNFRDLYWTVAQLLTHHASSGCNLEAGDLIASGTVSGPDDSSLGCLLELTRRGAAPLTLPNGETRRFLEDGDEVILRGNCEREGFVSIGLGECTGTIEAA